MRFYIIFIASRLIKIFANIVKISCYLFHFIFPNKRFTLPKQSNAIMSSTRPTKIPRILWQTNYTNKVSLPVYINYLFNRIMSPTFEYRFMGDEDILVFIKDSFPIEIFEHYSRLQIGAAKADFWRVLALQKYGGVYMDIDGHLVWPLGFLINSDDNELFITIRNGEITNYFFASKNDNSHLDNVISAIITNIDAETIKNTYDLTGPGVFNQTLDRNTVHLLPFRYVCNQGNFTNEHFQYMDKPIGKWTKEQQVKDIIKK